MPSYQNEKCDSVFFFNHNYQLSRFPNNIKMSNAMPDGFELGSKLVKSRWSVPWRKQPHPHRLI